MSAKVISVDGVAVEKVMEQLRRFVPHENDMVVLALTAPMLGRPGALLAAGVPLKDSAAISRCSAAGGLLWCTRPCRPALRGIRAGRHWTARFRRRSTNPTGYRATGSGSSMPAHALHPVQRLRDDPAKPFGKFSEEVAHTIGERHPPES